MTARNTTPRRYNHVDVCLQCGGLAANAAQDCAHGRTARLELTPAVKRALTQLRGARSYVRYLTERFNEMVQIEALAQETVSDASPRRGRKLPVSASDVIAVQAIDERQASLFG